MDPALLADLIVVAHLGYVLFVIFGLVLVLVGAALSWRWVRGRVFRVTHLVCTLIVPVEALGGVMCPLTRWESDLRREAGERPEDISFMGRVVREILFYDVPPWVLTTCYVVFGLSVIVAFFKIPPAWRSRSA